jgi:hypothetical protein
VAVPQQHARDARRAPLTLRRLRLSRLPSRQVLADLPIFLLATENTTRIQGSDNAPVLGVDYDQGLIQLMGWEAFPGSSVFRCKKSTGQTAKRQGFY